jgi:hypothetical protein
VELKRIRFERGDNIEQRVIIGIDSERDLAGAAVYALAGVPRLNPARARRKNTKPTRSVPESSATSSASGVLRPQILITRGM